MTEAAAEKLKSLGWSSVDASGFIALVGPLWHRVVDGLHEYALVAEDKHHNRRGVVQGGVLMMQATDRISYLETALKEALDAMRRHPPTPKAKLPAKTAPNRS